MEESKVNYNPDENDVKKYIIDLYLKTELNILSHELETDDKRLLDEFKSYFVNNKLFNDDNFSIFYDTIDDDDKQNILEKINGNVGEITIKTIVLNFFKDYDVSIAESINYLSINSNNINNAILEILGVIYAEKITHDNNEEDEWMFRDIWLPDNSHFTDDDSIEHPDNDIVVNFIRKNNVSQDDSVEMEQSQPTDFGRIMLICSFMINPNTYTPNHLNEAEIDFLFRILGYNGTDGNGLYHILKDELNKENDGENDGENEQYFMELYFGLTQYLLKYLNMLNTIITYETPFDVNKEILELHSVKRDVGRAKRNLSDFLGVQSKIADKLPLPMYQIHHYRDFLNDIIKEKVNEMFISKKYTAVVREFSFPEQRLQIKDILTQYIFYATINNKYQLLYYLLLLYVEVSFDAEPKDYLILDEIYVTSKNGLLVNYKLFYETYTIFYDLAPDFLRSYTPKIFDKLISSRKVDKEIVNFVLEIGKKKRGWVSDDIIDDIHLKNYNSKNYIITCLKSICSNDINILNINEIRSLFDNTDVQLQTNVSSDIQNYGVGFVNPPITIYQPDAYLVDYNKNNKGDESDAKTDIEDYSSSLEDDSSLDFLFNKPTIISSLKATKTNPTQKQKQNIVKRKRENKQQIGGNCKRFLIDALLDSLRCKFFLEASHDLDSERGKEAVYNGENIFNVLGDDLYLMVADTLKIIVGEIDIELYKSETYEAKIINNLKTNIKTVDEPKYLSMIIDHITTNCPDRVDEFFYYKTIDFILRDVEQNKILYEKLKEKIMKDYPFPDWWLVMQVKEKTTDGKKTIDLYLYVIKKETRDLNNTSLKFYEQDMGIGEALDIALQENSYLDAYNTLFNTVNDINLFFIPSTNYTLNSDYKTAIIDAKKKRESGVIKVNDLGKVEIDKSIWIKDPPKSIDPLSVEHPVYGAIFKPISGGLIINDNSISNIEILYIGYPDTLPELVPPLVALKTSKFVFDSTVDALKNPDNSNISVKISNFLKNLNDLSIQATIEAINQLLGFWINQPGITKYQFILDASEEIIGYKFTDDNTFEFTVYIGDLTVTNICKTMIAFYRKEHNSDARYRRIVEQMENIRRHPNYRYTMQNAGIDGSTDAFALTIIATIKSFGDEIQRIASEILHKNIKAQADVSPNSQNIWLLSSDRPLIAQGLLHGQPLIAELIIPHSAFGIQNEITDKIQPVYNTLLGKNVNIHNVNGGVLSNLKSLLTVVKTKHELLKDALNDFNAARDELFMTVTISDFPKLGSVQNVLDNLKTTIVVLNGIFPDNNAYPSELRTDDEQRSDGELLTQCRENIGKIKQLLISLEYYKAFSGIQSNEITDLYVYYINSQIKNAISQSIDAPTFTLIKAFNSKGIDSGGINNVADLNKALSNMCDNFDFYSKLFDIHDIACEAFINKINMYKQIIKDSECIEQDIKTKIITEYDKIINKIGEINTQFTKDANDKLKKLIEEREKRPSREKKKILEEKESDLLKGQQLNEEKNLATIKKDNELLIDKITKLEQILQQAKQEELEAKKEEEEAKQKITVIETEITTLKQHLSKSTKNSQDYLNISTILTNKKKELEDAKNAKEEAKKEVKKNKAATELAASNAKSVKAQGAQSGTFIAKLTEKITKLENQINITVQQELSKIHTKSTEVVKNLRTWISNKVSSKGGKKTRKNRKGYKKKNTKRQQRQQKHNKKTQVHLKVKKHRNTKKK